MDNSKRITLPKYFPTRNEKWGYSEQMKALGTTASLLTGAEAEKRAEYFAMKAEEQRSLATKLLSETARSYGLAIYEHKFLARVAKMYARVAEERKHNELQRKD